MKPSISTYRNSKIVLSMYYIIYLVLINDKMKGRKNCQALATRLAPYRTSRGFYDIKPVISYS